MKPVSVYPSVSHTVPHRAGLVGMVFSGAPESSMPSPASPPVSPSIMSGIPKNRLSSITDFVRSAIAISCRCFTDPNCPAGYMMSAHARDVPSPWTSAPYAIRPFTPAAATSCMNRWPYSISLSARGFRLGRIRPTVGICRFRSTLL
jgi:hypothetical protein